MRGSDFIFEIDFLKEMRKWKKRRQTRRGRGKSVRREEVHVVTKMEGTRVGSIKKWKPRELTIVSSDGVTEIFHQMNITSIKFVGPTTTKKPPTLALSS